MYRRLYPIGAVAALVVQSAAFAQPPASQSAPPSDPNEVVCRRMPPRAGTIMPRRVCKPRSEWQAEAQGLQAQDTPRRPMSVGRPGNGS